MSVADDYRLLLAAYPARLRRRHGAELITTMLEMAGPGGTPSARDRRDVLLDGLRERFRLPAAGRPFALVAAVLALFVGGALGAAAGSFAGAQAYAPLPDGRVLGEQVLEPGGNLLEDSQGRYYLTVMDDLPAEAEQSAAAEQVRQRLTAQGWTTSAVTPEGDSVQFRASDGGTELAVWVSDWNDLVQIAGWPARPASYVPLVLGGALLGMLAGWLVAASLTHRIAGAQHRRRSAVVAGAGLVLLLVPAVLFLLSLGWYLLGDHATGNGGLLHTFGTPAFGLSDDLRHHLGRRYGLYNTFGDAFLHNSMAIAGLAALAVAALLARPRHTRPDAAPA
mgnify:CR=1 FL=1